MEQSEVKWEVRASYGVVDYVNDGSPREFPVVFVGHGLVQFCVGEFSGMPALVVKRGGSGVVGQRENFPPGTTPTPGETVVIFAFGNAEGALVVQRTVGEVAAKMMQEDHNNG